MTPQEIMEVEAECQRLLRRIGELKNVTPGSFDKPQLITGQLGWSAPLETGAVRRASMDLTRALARMRRRG